MCQVKTRVMPMVTPVRKTYKYWLYTSKRDGRLHDQIHIAGIIGITSRQCRDAATGCMASTFLKGG
jgi:hypothetical protein